MFAPEPRPFAFGKRSPIFVGEAGHFERIAGDHFEQPTRLRACLLNDAQWRAADRDNLRRAALRTSESLRFGIDRHVFQMVCDDVRREFFDRRPSGFVEQGNVVAEIEANAEDIRSNIRCMIATISSVVQSL